jgi:antitoxin CptB
MIKSFNKDIFLKQLLYRSNNRGCKETDILLGNFAKKYLNNMTDQELQDFAIILEQDDVEILDWITGKDNPPEKLNNSVMYKLLSFRLNE